MIKKSGIAIVLFAASSMSQAADVKNGQALHDENCMKCHDTGVYTREDRKMSSAGGLRNQVQRCEQTLDLKWFEDDIDDVTGYLNQQYYRF